MQISINKYIILPVSYTHLLSFLNHRERNMGGFIFYTGYFFRSRRALPVSYTHLDVYKRQAVPIQIFFK